MESTTRLVQTWMASEREEEIAQTVSEISNGSTTLHNVVKALGEYLTSEEDRLRTKGVEFLSSVLSRCPADKLNRQSARVLTAFYCSKLEDTETIIPALKGLVSLTALPSSTSEDVPTILNAIFAHVRMKALVQSVRFTVFTIIDTLMARHRDVLKNMKRDFLSRYIALAEGEKDPRNLLVAFAIARVILIEFDISESVESLFDITFCYFPITFRPPPNDPYGISTDDLRIALRSCLSATPSFGLLAIPVFLEKLAAGSPVTKRDTLETMSHCLPIYGPAVARSNARNLWNALKLEIFQPTDSLTEEKALKTTQDLIKVIHPEDLHDSNEDAMQGLARDACEECIMILREPEKSQAKPAIKVLSAFMSTTPSVSRFTLAQAVPHLLKLYTSPDDIAARPSVLLLLSDLIAAARDSMSTVGRAGAESSELPLLPFKDEVLGIVTSALKTPATRHPALACLLGLVSTKNLLSDEELGFIVHSVDEILQDDSDEGEDASAPALQLLSTISLSAPHHIKEQTLPLLFASLHDQPPARDAVTERTKSWRILSALNTLCRQPELFETFVIRLTTKVEFLCLPLESTATADTEPTSAYAHSILLIIHQTLLAKVEEGHVDVAKYIESLVPRLFNIFLYAALNSNVAYSIATDPRLVVVAGKIITTIVQALSLQRQEAYTEALFSAFLEGNVRRIAEGQQSIPTTAKFNPFDVSAPAAQRNLVILLAAAVVALHKELRLPVSELNSFLATLSTWSIDIADDGLQREAGWQMIAAILNKRSADAPAFLESRLKEFWPTLISNTSSPLATRQKAIRAWVWITKALLVSNHARTSQFTGCLFEAFSDEAINVEAAKAFGDIVSVGNILTKRNHAVIKLLYAQRFVNGILPRITAGAADSTKPTEQMAYLVALTSLISAIPKALYVHEMPSLIPLLIRGLDLPEVNIRSKVINTFLAVAEGDSPDKSLVSDHAPSLVTTMLRNSLVQEMPSVKVRTAALQYLAVLPGIVRYDILHPYKATVIRELAKALDDPKRSVRKEAVDARTSWFKCNG